VHDLFLSELRGSLSGIYRNGAGFVENEDVVVLGIGTVHSGRPNRHSQYRQAGDLWFFLQQALDHILRHMTFDNVALHYRDVALPDPRWHAELGVYRIQLRLRDFLPLDLKSIAL